VLVGSICVEGVREDRSRRIRQVAWAINRDQWLPITADLAEGVDEGLVRGAPDRRCLLTRVMPPSIQQLSVGKLRALAVNYCDAHRRRLRLF